jgi:transcriptional regulator with XRE-family HTH domain
MNETPQEFAAKIVKARSDLGLTMEQVAARAGVSVKTVWSAEQGSTKTHRNNRRALADALGLDLEAAS